MHNSKKVLALVQHRIEQAMGTEEARDNEYYQKEVIHYMLVVHSLLTYQA